MKDLIIFGIGKIAEVLYYFFKNESDYNVVAFTCDKEYLTSKEIDGKPVIPFDEIQNKFSPGKYNMFIAVGYQDLNELREKRYLEAKEKGYKIISYVNPSSGMPKDTIIGENCFIMNNVCIHPKVKIGNNTFVWSGTMIGHHSEIGDNCWLTSSTNISGVVKVGNNCFFAVNSTVGHGVQIGSNCFIGANALVTKCLKDNQVVIAENTPVFRLDSKNFLKISKFSNL